MKLAIYDPTSPNIFDDSRLDFVKRESSFKSNVYNDKNKNNEKNIKKKPLVYVKKFNNLSFKTCGIKLLFIFIQYKHLNGK